MRRVAITNQKGGVGKTTTCVNLGAALAHMGQGVVMVDMDPQANLSVHLGLELGAGEPSTYTVLNGSTPFGAAIRPTATEGLSIVPSHLDLSGAELEMASAIGRETLLRDAIDAWEREGGAADFLFLDCPPSLGLLSVNGLAAAGEVMIPLQTEFFALQGMSKLLEVVQVLQRRLNPGLAITGILPCLYDGRLRLAREVLGEIRRYFPEQAFDTPIRSNVSLAEAPSHGQTIFEYAPRSSGARDHRALAQEVLAQGRPDPLADPPAAGGLPDGVHRDEGDQLHPVRPPGSDPEQLPEVDLSRPQRPADVHPKKARDSAGASYNFGGDRGEDRSNMFRRSGPSPSVGRTET